MIHTDHLGTPYKMTDANQAVVWSAYFKPFGAANVTVSTITNNLRLPGQYFDVETGLNYNYYRDYNPVIGRYVESDPLGLRGGINLYLYASANSIRFTDPRGLLLGGSGAIIGSPAGTMIGPMPPSTPPGTHGSPICMNCVQPPGLPPSSPNQCKPCKLDVGEFAECLMREYAQAQDETWYCSSLCRLAVSTRNPVLITGCAGCLGVASGLVKKCHDESCH